MFISTFPGASPDLDVSPPQPKPQRKPRPRRPFLTPERKEKLRRLGEISVEVAVALGALLVRAVVVLGKIIVTMIILSFILSILDDLTRPRDCDC